ncbi:MAG: hypothetical protein A3F33_02170, partial [Candidatus Woykebacteria bacterium RIFCSPHIGHO2_12_FULL_43_10]
MSIPLIELQHKEGKILKGDPSPFSYTPHKVLHEGGLPMARTKGSKNKTTKTVYSTVNPTIEEKLAAPNFQLDNSLYDILPKEDGTELEGIRRKVFTDRYSNKDAKGEPTELHPEDMWRRISVGIASVEKTAELRAKWATKFYSALKDFKFVPAGRILSGAGTGYEVTFYNCFVIPSPHDSRGGIIDNLKTMIEIMSRSGGVGINLSSLRPRGARVKKVNGTASGPVNWAELYSVATHDVIQQGGSRRGALMLMMNDWHPDIEEFITVKQDLSRINGANLSVCVSDSFMKAVKEDLDWNLLYPNVKDVDYDRLWDGDIKKWISLGKEVEVWKTVKARSIWDLVCEAAWKSAEPGVVFIERYNKLSNTWYYENIISVNPCVTADTWIQTNTGPRQVKEIIGIPFRARIDGQNQQYSIEGFFKTGTKKVLKVQTKEGYSLKLTSDHQIKKVTESQTGVEQTTWCEAGKLEIGDKVLLNDHRQNNQWSGNYTYDEGYLIGLLIGDGTLKSNEAVLSVWQPQNLTTEKDTGIMTQALASANTLPHRSDFKGWMSVTGRYESRLSLASIKKLGNRLGLYPGHKKITPHVEKTSSIFYQGFLRGMFDADGSVQGSQEKGVSVRLSQSDLNLLEAVQRMLLRLGIVSHIYQNRRKDMLKMLPNGKGGYKKYATKAQHELIISGSNLLMFAENIGFGSTAKAERLKKLLDSYKRGLNKEAYTATVIGIVENGVEDVYDAKVPTLHAFDANGFYVHNCGEQGLPAWGVCNLGALNLSAFVKNGQMDYEELVEKSKIAMRFLDNVVDANYYFYEENERQQKSTRRTGLGTMGLGDALIKMKIRYGSDESLPVIEKIYQTIRDASYDASAQISSEKGPFPMFDKEKYLQGAFIKQLPNLVQEKIAAKGIRNAVLLTQAPTGTTSLLAGASSGIEPVYDFAMIRRDRTGEHTLYHPLYEEWKNAHPNEEVPSYFASANDLTPEDHVRVQAIIQKYTDSSISKTVNAPNSHTVTDVKKLYNLAYELGCKGVTYMRDGSRAGVLEHITDKKEAKVQESRTDLPQPVGLRIRPDILLGATYKVRTHVGTAFITINADETGRPFEVFMNVGKAGSDIKADAEALGRLISLAYRIPSAYSAEDITKELTLQLRGIGGSDSLGFGNGRVRSLADAVAKVLEDYM